MTLKARNTSTLSRSSAKLSWRGIIFDRKKVSGHVFSAQVRQTFIPLLGKEEKSWAVYVNDKKVHSSYQHNLYKPVSIVVGVSISGDGFAKVQWCILDICETYAVIKVTSFSLKMCSYFSKIVQKNSQRHYAVDVKEELFQ